MHKTIMLALPLVCGAAQAAEWVSLGKFTDGSSELIDVSSIRVAGSVRNAWLKNFYPRHTERGTGDDANKWSITIYLAKRSIVPRGTAERRRSLSITTTGPIAACG